MADEKWTDWSTGVPVGTDLIPYVDLSGTPTNKRTTPDDLPISTATQAAIDAISPSLTVFDVKAYGAVGDNSTDDTVAIQDTIDAAVAAGGGTVYFPRGIYVVGGALQDTSNANAQLLLPEIDYVDSEQITIEFRGEFPPPPIVSVIGTTPVPDNHSIVRTTLNTGTDGNVLGGRKASGSLDNFTNVFVIMRDLTWRMPSNPVLTALDFEKVAAIDIDQVVIDVGSYYVEGLTEPTTNTSVGLKCPGNNNGAFTRLGAVNVVGMYHGYTFGEHSNGEQVGAWGCKQAARFLTATNHASHFDRFLAVHCERVLTFAAYHPVTIAQLDIEHAASGWWVTDYDIDDASNFGYGEITWHVVLAGVGPDDTFTINGGVNLITQQVGASAEIIAAEIRWAIVLTQAEYDAIGTPQPETLYVIVG